jgi:hypothetical protein
MRNLGTQGLSMSDCQSLSNLCNQEAINIDKKLKSVGLFDKSVKIDNVDKIIHKTDRMPDNVKELLERKALLHSLQGFLMDSMKRKDAFIKEENERTFVYDVSRPIQPTYEVEPQLKQVDEIWGFDQLTDDEYNEYIRDEAFASHIGQFIHDKSILDSLRKEVYKIPAIEWIELKKDEKTPVDILVHHKPEFYDDLHKELSNLHRDYEKKVNYIKAKVKNLVAEENQKLQLEYKQKLQEISERNRLLREEYNKEFTKWTTNYNLAKSTFEKEKIEKVNDLAKLKIVLYSKYESLKNELMK